MSLPIVAIVGRPNVGKSTLVNRIVGKRDAIVEEKPGVTRDRKEVDAEWQGVPFLLVDTGGWMPGGADLDAKVSRQSEQAIREADAVLLVVDAVTGVTEEDARIAEVVRQLAAGRCSGRQQGRRRQPRRPDLGGHVARPRRAVPASARCTAAAPATCSTGCSTLLPDGAAACPRSPTPFDERRAGADRAERVFSVALVGRPNVGKSTLFNRLIGEERAVVHDMPGTTRDTIDTVVETADGPDPLRRHRRHAPQGQDRRGHRVLLAGPGPAGRRRVRRRPAGDRRHRGHHRPGPAPGRAHRRRRLPGRGAAQQVGAARRRAAGRRHLPGGRAPALHRRGARCSSCRRSPARACTSCCPALSISIEDYHRRVPTRRVNEVIRAAQQAQPGPARRARCSTPRRAPPTRPPSPCSPTRRCPPTYLRYLERMLREAFDLGATPIKMRVRKRSN